MKSYSQRMRETRRLILLRLLSEQNGYRANAASLHIGLHSLDGLTCSRDDVLTDLAWLAEQHLIDCEQTSSGVTVATLLQRGQDVVDGNARVPGIAGPGLKQQPD